MITYEQARDEYNARAARYADHRQRAYALRDRLRSLDPGIGCRVVGFSSGAMLEFGPRATGGFVATAHVSITDHGTIGHAEPGADAHERELLAALTR